MVFVSVTAPIYILTKVVSIGCSTILALELIANEKNTQRGKIHEGFSTSGIFRIVVVTSVGLNISKCAGRYLKALEKFRQVSEKFGKNSGEANTLTPHRC